MNIVFISYSCFLTELALHDMRKGIWQLVIAQNNFLEEQKTSNLDGVDAELFALDKTGQVELQIQPKFIHY